MCLGNPRSEIGQYDQKQMIVIVSETKLTILLKENRYPIIISIQKDFYVRCNFVWMEYSHVSHAALKNQLSRFKFIPVLKLKIQNVEEVPAITKAWNILLFNSKTKDI